MTSERPAPRFAMGRSIAALVALVTLGALLVVGALLALGQGEQVAAALAGAAVALVAGIAGLMPLHWADRRPASTVPMLAMSGTGLRMVVTLAGAVVLIVAGGLVMPAAALWVLVWYLVVMVFEITLLIRYLRSFARPSGRSQRGADHEQ